MSKTSNWPLSSDSERMVSPVVIRQQLQQHPLTKDCYPLAVGRYEKALSHEMSRNRHDDNILIYCFSGKGFLHTHDWSGEIQSGELVLLPRGVNHRYWANVDDPWSIYWCHFSGHQAQEYVYNMDYKKELPILKVGHSPVLMAQFRSVLAESSTGYNTPAMVYAANMLKQLLAYIGMLAQQIKTPERQQFNLDILQAYMLQNLNKSIDLDALSSQVNLSKFHFSKKYKEATGFSPVQHFLKMKVEYASYLLETSELAIQGIASRVGYDDSLYFSRLFKKHTGLSPSAYRKRQYNQRAV
ncbi:AraC family transcriptional regulator [Aliiglaciecola sp. 3_MG-2023]|uniref:AraC family transcriptional regulator n=1 Tax=Aliiglaciecola sp. 3_MG-2023 TaxID=3062644 RepID=UPI0026E3D7B6|nr:AraC family transcriptional regulator [Aliiglaciecola sp. 3_MG-2023]MDO6693113.1 AraC family transcriptional regulator [Aliiglaciecola sp. 3_MG-2023]